MIPPMYQKTLKQWVILLYSIVVTYVTKNIVCLQWIGFLSNEMKNIKRMLIVSFCAMCTKYEQFFIHISQKLKKSKNRLVIYFLV